MAAKRSRSKPRPSPAEAPNRPARGGAGPGEDRVEQVQRLVDVMTARGVVEVELEDAAGRVRVRLKEDRAVALAAPAPFLAAPVPASAGHAPAPAARPESGPAPAAPAPREGKVFESPMVGTFYVASSPDAEPFVKVGDRVKPETTLCIIEAMKVMNEIKAECDGTVLEVLAQNGESVEYGQPLFRIKG
ncbi:MAG: acetyl-CoA carboxylase biotin carboxyl carrier protein [Planctomycetes bacterium]|nr:acetyl-CoA carboxylase biotin carboxyl carrier protein [Planctomycetota bacterium]